MWRGKGLVYLYFQVTVQYPGKARQEVKAGSQGRNLETRTEAETMKELCPGLALAQPAFL